MKSETKSKTEPSDELLQRGGCGFFNSGTFQEGQLSFHGDQTSNISTDQTKKKKSTFLGVDQRTEIIF